MRHVLVAVGTLTLGVVAAFGCGYQPGDTLDVIVVPDAEGALPADTRVTCDAKEYTVGELQERGVLGESRAQSTFCNGELRVALPSGLSRVDWVLDPAAPAPDPASTRIAVLATEQDCNSGNPVGERLLGPQVVETADAVLVTFAAIERTGNAECPSNPATAVTVTLPSPLGDRELRDGLYVGQLSELASP